MSLLGLHIASDVRTRFRDYLATGNLSCVVSIDQNVQAEVKSIDRRVATFFRTQRSRMGEDNPPGFMDYKLEYYPDLAQHWMNSIDPVWQQNFHDALIVNNEQDIATLGDAEKLNRFFWGCIDYANRRGYKVVIANMSTGNPADDGGLTLEQRWEPMLPSIAFAAEGGHYLGLHAHPPSGMTLSETARDIAFRHERSLEYFKSKGINPQRPWVVITELSMGANPGAGNYMPNVQWWDTMAANSVWRRQLVGGALYGYNAAETLDPAAKRLIEWIGSFPTPYPTVPPQSVTTSIVIQSGKPYSVTYDSVDSIRLSLPFGTKYEVARQ